MPLISCSFPHLSSVSAGLVGGWGGATRMVTSTAGLRAARPSRGSGEPGRFTMGNREAPARSAGVPGVARGRKRRPGEGRAVCMAGSLEQGEGVRQDRERERERERERRNVGEEGRGNEIESNTTGC